MNHKVINFILFQIGWFACVLGAASNISHWALLVALVVVITHLIQVDKPAREILFLAIVTALGYAWDSLLVALDLFEYADTTLTDFAPLWIAAMWLMFATTLNSSLSWLQERFILASVLGGLLGPVAYYSASKLGAVSLIEMPDALIFQAIGWAILMPAFLLTIKILNDGQQQFSWGANR